MAASALRTVTLRCGDRIDHYLIESLAARSGMASIFRATDLRSGQPLAIKVPHPEVENDPVSLARFEREAEIGSYLDHPGVMKVFAGEDRSRSRCARLRSLMACCSWAFPRPPASGFRRRTNCQMPSRR